MDFHGERRRNDTHQSTTNPQARLYRKGSGREATWAYLRDVLLDNRHGLVANVCVTAATGTAERDAGAWMLAASAPPGCTVGADKGYDTALLSSTRSVVWRSRYTSRRRPATAPSTAGPTRHPGYQLSQRMNRDGFFGGSNS